MSSISLKIDGIMEPISRELDSLEREITKIFSSRVELISAIGKHLMTMKGKRVRPALVLLSAKVGAPDMDVAVKVGVAVEIIHTATLLHDDSIDRSYLRRGLPTVNKLWNDQVSVIVGDYLFCRAFKLLHEAGLFEVASVLSRGSESMTFGEMFQMDLRGKYDILEETYLEMIKHKTASLFSSACEAGAMIGGLTDDEKSKLGRYGEHVGVAFQIVDDILDFVGDTDLMGKPVGNDLKDGRVTLPLIVGLRSAGRDEAAKIRRIIHSGNLSDSDWREIVLFLERNGGLEYSRKAARKFAEIATDHIASLRPCPAKNALTLIAEHVVSRQK